MSATAKPAPYLRSSACEATGTASATSGTPLTRVRVGGKAAPKSFQRGSPPRSWLRAGPNAIAITELVDELAEALALCVGYKTPGRRVFRAERCVPVERSAAAR